MKQFKAILFDFDGVLADTMQDNYLAWKKAFADKNITIIKKDYFPLEGMKLIEVAKTILTKYHSDAKPEDIVISKNNYYLKNNSFRFYNGVDELIDKAKDKNKLIAIVSASPRQKLEKTVPKYFLDKFDIVISGDDYTRGKPDPEPYQTALKILKLRPEDAFVVENAPLGIKSAKAAGIYCIAVTTTLTKKFLTEADEILKYEKLKDRLLDIC